MYQNTVELHQDKQPLGWPRFSRLKKKKKKGLMQL